MAMRIGSMQSTALVSTGGEEVSGLPLGHPHLKIQVFICNVKCILMLQIVHA